MHSPGIFSLRSMRLGFAGALVICGVSGWACKSKPQTTPTPVVQPLSANDVSWLFPAPTQAADFANLIAVRDITTPNPQDPTKRDPVWTDAAFQQFLTIVNGPQRTSRRHTGASQLTAQEARSSTPGSSPESALTPAHPASPADIRAQFGQLPEIRLIIQPIIKNPDGSPKVLDIAGHLIFDFVTCRPGPPSANRIAFRALRPT